MGEGGAVEGQPPPLSPPSGPPPPLCSSSATESGIRSNATMNKPKFNVNVCLFAAIYVSNEWVTTWETASPTPINLMDLHPGGESIGDNMPGHITTRVEPFVSNGVEEVEIQWADTAEKQACDYLDKMDCKCPAAWNATLIFANTNVGVGGCKYELLIGLRLT